ncbi:MAG: shikimate kinase [Clostridia bacterium]|nr:shikimate kinase [Clostridia bacterium]
MAKNIVLIGMSGCGKTSIGEILAKKLGYTFLDTDEITESYGMTIEELFESGEKSFRCVETMAVKEAASYEKAVISTGGGVVTVAENMNYLSDNAVVFFVKRSLESIKKSLQKDKNKRPLLKNDNSLDKLYLKRVKLYEKYADYIVDNNSSIYKVCDEIIQKYKETEDEDINS